MIHQPLPRPAHWGPEPGTPEYYDIQMQRIMDGYDTDDEGVGRYVVSKASAAATGGMMAGLVAAGLTEGTAKDKLSVGLAVGAITVLGALFSPW